MMKFITAICAIGIAGTIFMVYTKPAYARIQALQTEVAVFDDALNQSRELQELKRALLARYNTFPGDQLARLSKMLPDHVDNVRLVLDLDNMAAKYGMAVQNVVISRGEEQEDEQNTVLGSLGSEGAAFDSLLFQFSTTGTYGNLISFLSDLESSLRVVDLVTLSIEPSGEESAEPTYTYDISIRTYWLK
jgi:Tfp pilus assembly protein PilO